MRPARHADVPALVGLLSDDVLGERRETTDLATYHAAFDAMAREPGNAIFVAMLDGRLVGTYQLTFITGLSLRAARRAQIESVRVARDLRGRGIGRILIGDAEARARDAGCTLLQLTSNTARADARRFYIARGFTASHAGFKKPLQ